MLHGCYYYLIHFVILNKYAFMLSGEELKNLTMLFQEEQDSFVVDSGQDSATYPHLLRREGLYDVVIEGTKVASCTELSEAMLLLVWGMTIFHQKHGKLIKKTSVYLERYVLRIFHPVKVSLAVSQVYSKLTSKD